MKLSHFISVLMLVMVFAFTTEAQWTQNYTVQKLNGTSLVQFKGEIDSLVTLTSNTFTLSNYDKESFMTYPLTMVKKTGSTGTPKIDAFVKGSFDKTNWITCDTLMLADSVKTYSYNSVDLNNRKFPYYQVVVTGVTTNGLNSTFDIWLYLYRKE